MAKAKRIVVLDDDRGSRTAIKRVLIQCGFDAELFGTVEGFLDGVRLEGASCLVLDINLNGHCGIELRKELARRNISVPVIFVTAADDVATKQAALEAGCVAYLQKPFPSRDLIEALDRVA